MERWKRDKRTAQINGPIVSVGFILLIPFAFTAKNIWEGAAWIAVCSLASYWGYRAWRWGSEK